MVEALAHVQNTVSRDADAAQCEFENLPGRLVGCCLLSRNDLIEFHSKLRQRGSEEIIVHVRDDGQSKAALEFPERGYRVGPRLPIFQRLRQRAGFLMRWSESQLLSELPHHRLKDFAIAAILPLLGARLEISVEAKDRGIVSVFAVGCEDPPQAAENSVLPFDECAVTIKGGISKRLKSSMVDRRPLRHGS